MAKYIRCVAPTGSVVLFDGLVSMEKGDELRLSDAAFLDSEVQDGILVNFTLIEINAPGSSATAEIIMQGNWDAFTESNYPPEVYGHTYYITAAGQLTNGVQTEDYSVGDRILFNLNDTWELLGGGSSVLGYTGAVWVKDVYPVDDSYPFEVIKDVQGYVTDFTTSAPDVYVILGATPNELGAAPAINFNAVPVPMTPVLGGFEGTAPFTMATGTFQATHENGATYDVNLTLEDIIQITSVVPDASAVLTGLRTELTFGDFIDLTVTTNKAYDRVEVQNYGVSRAVASQGSFGTLENHSAITRAGQGNGTIRLRVGITTGQIIEWSDWFETAESFIYSDLAPTMTKGDVLIHRINAITGLPYNYLTDTAGANQASIVNNVFTNCDEVAITSGTSGNIGGLPTSTDPGSLTSFTVIGVGVDKFSADDREGKNAIVYTMTKHSNGVQSVVGDQLIPYYSRKTTVEIITNPDASGNSQSLVSSPTGEVNWIGISAPGLEETFMLKDTVTLDAGVNGDGSGGVWDPEEWQPASEYIGADPLAAYFEDDGAIFVRKLIITDDMVKGEYAWANLTAETISGDQVTWGGFSSYLLAGFAPRDVTFFPGNRSFSHIQDNPDHEHEVGTNLGNPTVGQVGEACGYYAILAPSLVDYQASLTPSTSAQVGFVYDPTQLVAVNNTLSGAPMDYVELDNRVPGESFNTTFTMMNRIHGFGGTWDTKITVQGITNGQLTLPVQYFGAVYFNRNALNSANHGLGSITIEEQASPWPPTP